MSKNMNMLHDTALSFVYYIGQYWIVLSWTDYIKDNFSIKSHILNNADNLEKDLNLLKQRLCGLILCSTF